MHKISLWCPTAFSRKHIGLLDSVNYQTLKTLSMQEVIILFPSSVIRNANILP